MPNAASSLKTHEQIEFIDLNAQQEIIRDKIDAAIAEVLRHGKYIMGPEIYELEKRLSEFCGAKESITCSNGTDALMLVLMALEVGTGDAVFVPSFTFAATAEVVAILGATPVFVDSDASTFNICPQDLKQAIEWAQTKDLSLKGIIPVDLFGLPADYDQIETIAKTHDMWILDDAAQGFGGEYKGRKIGTIGKATATSFFPAKPLGCYGDGGAIFTDDSDLAETIKSMRVHGKGHDKYDNVRIGMNGRLDTIQAAILIHKLSIFPQEIKARNTIAQRYNENLSSYAQTPLIQPNSLSTWAQYTVVIPDGKNRDDIAASLKKLGIPTAVYYPKPLHQQTAYKHYGRGENTLEVCEKLSQQVLSLPMHPYLKENAQNYIIENFIKCAG